MVVMIVVVVQLKPPFNGLQLSTSDLPDWAIAAPAFASPIAAPVATNGAIATPNSASAWRLHTRRLCSRRCVRGLHIEL